jgi:hypothetical protein
MEKVNTKSYKIIPIFIISFLVLIGALYNTAAKANTASTPLSGTQLAYFVGSHYAPSYVYHGPRVYHHRPRAVYWSNWRYVGHGCRKSCLVDRWSHRVIRCKQVCNRYHRR